MTRFAKTTLVAALLAGAALAVPAWAQSGAPIDPSNLILAGDLEGGKIYSDPAGTWDATTPPADLKADWPKIGEIEDVVLDSSGQMVGVVADVGGFLGIGDKHVLLPIVSTVILPHRGDDGEYLLVSRETKDSLKAMPEVEKGLWD
ncbi:MAG: PRC-barrel domain-containing protein [Rhodobacteraceae bacterium]|nr:PRC-barrel domain-containing protein [Paracoccaceae bacterium]